MDFHHFISGKATFVNINIVLIRDSAYTLVWKVAQAARAVVVDSSGVGPGQHHRHGGEEGEQPAEEDPHLDPHTVVVVPVAQWPRDGKKSVKVDSGRPSK